MNKRIRDILTRITELEDELRDEIEQQQTRLSYRVEGTRIRFEKSVREVHQELKIGLLSWLGRSRPRNVLTAPVIYAMVLPLAALDLGISLYQLLCFPLYGVPLVRRRNYIVIDRHNLRYLNSIERLNCTYCGYANGVLAFAREVAASTEQYWCPIKHARKILEQHRRYVNFADFGDADSYHATVAKLRRELAAERSGADAGDAAKS